MKKLFIFFICNFALGLKLLAQNNIDPLDRNISINVTNMPIIEFLYKVSQIGKFTFSCNPNKLNASQKITCNLNNKAIRQILVQTLPNYFTFKSSGNHIILVVSQIQKPTHVTKPKYFKISGTITDQYTASKVSEVSVYDKKTLHSAVTDESGNFSLTIPYQNEEVLLRIKKEGYSDSSLYIKRDDLKFLEISLRPEKAMEISISIPKDSNAVNENSNIDTTMVSFVQDSNIVAIDEKSKMFDRILFLINKKMGLHYRNIKDTLFEKMQTVFYLAYQLTD